MLIGTGGALGIYHLYSSSSGSHLSGDDWGNKGSIGPPNFEVIAKVRRVSDGDTLGIEIVEVIDPHRGIKPGEDEVRLAGIDAEELHKRYAARKHEEVEEMSQSEYEETDYYHYASAAKELVRSLAPQDSKLYLDVDDLAGVENPYRGSYGRLIAVVYIENGGSWINVNAKVLHQGYPDHAWITGFKSEFHPQNWLSNDYPYV